MDSAELQFFQRLTAISSKTINALRRTGTDIHDVKANASDVASERRVIQVGLDLPSAQCFDYLAPTDADVSDAIGYRVLVPFGRRNVIGVAMDMGPSSVDEARLKPIVAVLRDTPRFDVEWLALVNFAARYYQRGIGETAMQSLPNALRLAAGYQFEEDSPGWTSKTIQRALGKLHKLAPHGSIDDCGLDARFASAPTPTEQQRHAINELRAMAARADPVPGVLHGVTGSGKTEVYLQFARDVVRTGRQVLVLVPEINLTPPSFDRFAERFGPDRVVALHSGLSDGARLRAWLAASTGTADIVLGTRLAALTPMPRLGAIVIDEEHDASYKQQEGLRYSARDLSIWRAHDRSIPVVLGSATPSLETWANCVAGRFQKIEMTERARSASKLPSIELIDTSKDKLHAGLSSRLVEALRATRARGEQSILFLNRRGYAPVLSCSQCGWVATCAQCSAHMVFHSADRRMHCHHCGAQAPIPRACPSCGNQDLAPLGRGTQRVEETLGAILPGARIVRIDADSTRRKGSAAALLDRVHAGEVDVLVGTQMIAKGHDFERVTLVGVIGADAALFSHDFRAPERLFQQLIQVAGRSGRAQSPGQVLIQSRYAHHPMFGALVAHDYARFAQSELDARRDGGMPPFSHQALLRADAPTLDAALDFLEDARARALALEEEGVRVFDAVPLRLVKRAGVERAQLLVESLSRARLQRFLPTWLAELAVHAVGRRNAQVKWHIEVDPFEI